MSGTNDYLYNFLHLWYDLAGDQSYNPKHSKQMFYHWALQEVIRCWFEPLCLGLKSSELGRSQPKQHSLNPDLTDITTQVNTTVTSLHFCINYHSAAFHPHISIHGTAVWSENTAHGKLSIIQ